MLVFLLALRNRSIASALARYGFDGDELKLGWNLLSNLSRGRLDVVITASPKLVDDVDAFENEWFPIAIATLQHKHPEAHELLFRNITQTTGAGAVINVRTFLERLDRLTKPKSEGGLGREGKAAMDLLAKRGLTPDVIAPVKRTLEEVAQIEPALEPERDPEDDATAEREMWEWYLQWSAIARVAVKERRLLKAMGFLQTSTGAVIEPDLEEEEDEDEGGEGDEDGGEEEEKPETPAA
ncbi:hypothetical protein DB32_007977 [Sandaracinus amylolyticus]|uniref:Uncharacterized protein n=1 Tax=Sandaracinus amylolyticus TaxID=927083 RepID=A0A0F6YM11_9BACT|nr:hypothetical protein DB32_007977 [Sandaracinus amylolyticus]